MHMRKKPWARPELASCPFFADAPEKWKGRWQEFFSRCQPVYLELGCGKGVFLAEAALKMPEINYIGIDINSDVLGVARRGIVERFSKAEREVDNLALLSYNVEQIQSVIEKSDRIERIYIHFCNPWPKTRHQKRRLTYPKLLEQYASFLSDNGEIFLKTDDDALFADSLDYLAQTGYEIVLKEENLAEENPWDSVLTEHEKKFRAQGITIKFLIARKTR